MTAVLQFLGQNSGSLRAGLLQSSLQHLNVVF